MAILLFFPALSSPAGPVNAGASAAISASATVVPPLGLIVSEASPSQSEDAVGLMPTVGVRESGTGALLVRFPPGSSWLLWLEADKRPVRCFPRGDAPESHECSRPALKAGSAEAAVDTAALLRLVPPGTSDVTVTVIATEN